MAIFGNNDIEEGYWDGNQYIFKKAQQPTYNVYDPAITPPSLLAPDIEPILSPVQYNYNTDRGSENRSVTTEVDPTNSGLFGGLNTSKNKSRKAQLDRAYAGIEGESDLSKISKVAGFLNPSLGVLGFGVRAVDMLSDLNEISDNDLGLGTSRSFWDKLIDPRSFAQQAYDAKNIADMVNKATDKYGRYGRPTPTGEVTTAMNSLAAAAKADRDRAAQNSAQMGRDVNTGGGLGGQTGGSSAGTYGGRDKAGHGGYGPSF